MNHLQEDLHIKSSSIAFYFYYLFRESRVPITDYTFLECKFEFKKKNHMRFAIETLDHSSFLEL